jgi:hypothetical protein
MTQGFLLFAHDNEEIDYGVMALWTARRISKWLDKPTSLVTDSNTISKLDATAPQWRNSFDKIIEQSSVATQTKRYVDRQLTFHNLDRIGAYDLTPYDETIVIDTDVLIQSNQLNKLWNSNEDLLLCDNSKDIYRRRDPEFEYLHETSIKFYWATTFYFKKTAYSKMFFDYCKNVKENYVWNKQIYSLMSGPVRNDFVWSIAAHNISHTDTIPWNIPYSPSSDKIIKLDDNSITLLTTDGLCKLKNYDLHIMNKFDLMEQIKKELV